MYIKHVRIYPILSKDFKTGRLQAPAMCGHEDLRMTPMLWQNDLFGFQLLDNICNFNCQVGLPRFKIQKERKTSETLSPREVITDGILRAFFLYSCQNTEHFYKAMLLEVKRRIGWLHATVQGMPACPHNAFPLLREAPSMSPILQLTARLNIHKPMVLTSI